VHSQLLLHSGLVVQDPRGRLALKLGIYAVILFCDIKCRFLNVGSSKQAIQCKGLDGRPILLVHVLAKIRHGTL